MAYEQHEQHMPAEGVQKIRKPADLEIQEGDVPDQVCVATLLQQINEHQEAYRMLYARNLLLYNELTDARQTIECLNALLHA
jgi:hypothetical protein